MPRTLRRHKLRKVEVIFYKNFEEHTKFPIKKTKKFENLYCGNIFFQRCQNFKKCEGGISGVFGNFLKNFGNFLENFWKFLEIFGDLWMNSHLFFEI
jgi:hypothetical protein